jgi:hypothetical protein
MRIRKLIAGVALVVPFALGGCGLLGTDSTMVPYAGETADPGPVTGAGWVVTDRGSATPSPAASRGAGTRPPALPPVSFLPVAPGCEKSWTVEPVLIPMTVEPGAGSLTVSWPRQYNSDYRVTAVPQPLVAGAQPDHTWQDVAAGPGCTATATITGLKSGTPYVVWLDAPDTGYERDGTRHPYSGKSGVVYPR